jgi:hypothetical protein
MRFCVTLLVGAYCLMVATAAFGSDAVSHW